MSARDFQYVLCMQSKTPQAMVSVLREAAHELDSSAAIQGYCRSQTVDRGQSTTAGVVLRNSIIPGEVVG